MPFEQRYDMVRDGVSLLLGQAVLEAPDDLASTYQGIGDGVTEEVASGHCEMRTQQELWGKRPLHHSGELS